MPLPSADSSSNERNIFVRRSLNFIVPQSDEKQFKAAVYNVLLFALFALCIAAITAIYFLLHAFLKPIFWAVLCGTVLFPFKRNLALTTKTYLRELLSSETPLVVAFILLPVKLLNATGEFLWSLFARKFAIYLVLIYPVFMLLAKYQAFSTVWVLVSNVLFIIDRYILFFSSYWLYPVEILYVAFYVGWLYVQDPNTLDWNFAKLLSAPAWMIGFCICSSFFGPFGRVPVFLCCCVLVSLNAVGLIGKIEEASTNNTLSSEKAPAVDKDDLSDQYLNRSASKGDMLLQYLFCTVSLLLCAKHLWVLSLALLPFAFVVLKKLGAYFGIWNWFRALFNQLWDHLSENYNYVYTAAVPSSIRQLAYIIFNGDRKVVEAVEQSMDIVSSILVMVGLLLVTTLMTTFIFFQVQSETLQLVALSSRVWNASQTQSSLLAEHFGFSGEQVLQGHSLESLVDQVYENGRSYLSNKVRSFAGDNNVERADLLEAEVKQLIDRVYEIWQDYQSQQRAEHKGMHNNNESTVSLARWNSLLNVKELSQELLAVLKENVSTVLSVAESIWLLIKSNLTLILSLLYGILNVLLGFGFELLNFVLSMVVFMTVLYYLLTYSDKNWLPMEWLRMVAPTSQSASENQAEGASAKQDDAETDPISLAIEEVINGVFVRSFKMAMFYGMYVWCTHTLFDIKFVFMPSLASILAVVPVFGAYLVCIPGALQLWLVVGPFLAVLFVVIHLAPMFFADPVFIQEVKGSHPYLTGLSVAGGIYWLGIQGALIGPILLCSVLALLQMYSHIMSSARISS